MAIKYRLNQIVPLTFQELDGNFQDLDGRVTTNTNNITTNANNITKLFTSASKAIVTASIDSTVNNKIKFTKGDASEFTITIATGSAAGFVTTSSFNSFTGSVITTGSLSSNQGITGSLTISGSTVISGSFYYSASLGSYNNIIVIDTGSGKLYFTSSISGGSGAVGPGAKNYLAFFSGSTTTISSSNVYYNGSTNIGINTSTPSYNLHVSGSQGNIGLLSPDRSDFKQFSGGNTTDYFSIYCYGGSYGNNYTSLGLNDSVSTTSQGAAVYLDTRATIPPIRFAVKPAGSLVMTSSLSIDTSGNVGIGTTTPYSSLHISSSNPLRINGLVTSSIAITDVLMISSSGQVFVTASSAIGGSGTIQGSGLNGYIAYWSGSTPVLSSSVMYQSASRVGIGTTTPSRSLDIESGGVLEQRQLQFTNCYTTESGIRFYGQNGSNHVIAIASSDLAFYSTNIQSGPTPTVLQKIFQLSNGIDTNPPILENRDSILGTGRYSKWTINASGSVNYDSLFSVRQYQSHTYNISSFTTNNTISFGVKPNGNGYFSGSVGIGTLIPTYSLDVSGSSQSIARFRGSGSINPLFAVEGSQGELFSVIDNLSGSLFSVNDISGLPILEVFSDNTTLIGSYVAPSLHTTVRTTVNTGSGVVIYQVPTSSYDGMFVEYTAKSGSVARVGTIMTTFSGSTTTLLEETSSIGTTTAISFGSIITGSNFAVSSSATTNGWTVKTIIRSI